MAVTRCKNGHFYDAERFSQCPHCGIFFDDQEEKTVAFVSADLLEDEEKTVAMRPLDKDAEAVADQKDQTIGIYVEKRGADYITGWLVCTKGPEKGRDYRLRHGFNRVGRDYSMDVVVSEDSSMSREACFAIVYEDRQNRFYAVQQPGGTAYLNGMLLESPTPITTGAILETGSSEFEFIAFCREGRVWEKS